MNVREMKLLDFAALLRNQARAVYVATEQEVADQLAASLNEAADRLIDLNRRAYLREGDSPPSQGTER